MTIPRLPKVGDEIRCMRKSPTNLWGLNTEMERLMRRQEMAPIIHAQDFIREKETLRGIRAFDWSWPIECLDICMDGVWYDGREILVYIQKGGVKETPPDRQYKVVSKVLHQGLHRSGHTHTSISIQNTVTNTTLLSPFVVESDLTMCCGMAGIRGVNRSLPRGADKVLIAELCAAMMNASLFGTPVHNIPRGYSPGNFFFSVTGNIVNKPSYSHLFMLFVDVFGATCIDKFLNEAHGPSEIHLFKMNLHKMNGIFVRREEDAWFPLPEKDIDGEGLFSEMCAKLGWR